MAISKTIEQGQTVPIAQRRMERRDFNRLALGVGVGLGKWHKTEELSQAIDKNYDLWDRRVRGAFERIGISWEKKKIAGQTLDEFREHPPVEFGDAYPGLLKDETDQVATIIYGEGLKVLGNYDQGTEDGRKNLVNLLNFDRVVGSKVAEGKVAPTYGKYMVGHAAAESRGDKDAESDAGAAGILQIMPETAKSVGMTIVPTDNKDSDEYRNRFTLDERFDVEKSIKGTIALFVDADERFGNIGYMLQAHHDGPGRLYEAMRKYARWRYNYDPGDLDPDFGSKDENDREALRQRSLYRQLVQGTLPINAGEVVQPVTMFHLTNSEPTHEMFEGKENDWGNIYVPRIIASTMIVRQFEDQIGNFVRAQKAA